MKIAFKDIGEIDFIAGLSPTLSPTIQTTIENEAVQLGRGLISAWLNPNGCGLDEGKVVCGEFVR